jgi:hypothetical protein
MSDYPKKKTPVPVQISAPSAGVEPWPPLRPSPPREVRNAFKLWIANLAFGFTMGFVIGFITALTARQRAAVSAQPVNVGAVIVGLLGALIVLGLEIFFLLKMRKGKNWARVIMTVLAGLKYYRGSAKLSAGSRVCAHYGDDRNHVASASNGSFV